MVIQHRRGMIERPRRATDVERLWLQRHGVAVIEDLYREVVALRRDRPDGGDVEVRALDAAGAPTATIADRGMDVLTAMRQRGRP